jgi:hypothetical protein
MDDEQQAVDRAPTWMDNLPKHIGIYEAVLAVFALVWVIVVVVVWRVTYRGLDNLAMFGTAMATPALVVTAVALFISARALMVQREEMKLQLKESRKLAQATDENVVVQKELLDAQRQTAKAMQAAAEAQARVAADAERARALGEVDELLLDIAKWHSALGAHFEDASEQLSKWRFRMTAGRKRGESSTGASQVASGWERVVSRAQGDVRQAWEFLNVATHELEACRGTLLSVESPEAAERRVETCKRLRSQLQQYKLDRSFRISGEMKPARVD